jgi:hypothetical protein
MLLEEYCFPVIKNVALNRRRIAANAVNQARLDGRLPFFLPTYRSHAGYNDTMLTYQVPCVGPSLNSAERLICNLLFNLADAQVLHRFHDPAEPPSPGIFTLLFRRRAMRRYWDERLTHRLTNPITPRPFLSLVQLWQKIVPPSNLDGRIIGAEDLALPNVVLSQRRGDGETSEEWYFTARPSSDAPLRCIVHFPAGRTFCTPERYQNLDAPSAEGTVPVRIQSKGFDDRGRLTVPVEMVAHLPAWIGPWELLQTKELAKLGEAIIKCP